MYGRGTEQSLQLGIHWFMRAAAMDHPGSMCALGNLLRRELDFAAALPWYRMALETAGQATAAAYWLGWCYANGNGIDLDRTSAARYMRRAAAECPLPHRIAARRWLATWDDSQGATGAEVIRTQPETTDNEMHLTDAIANAEKQDNGESCETW